MPKKRTALRRLRDCTEMNQVEFAQFTGLSISLVRQAEAPGVKKWLGEHARVKLCWALGVDGNSVEDKFSIPRAGGHIYTEDDFRDWTTKRTESDIDRLAKEASRMVKRLLVLGRSKTSESAVWNTILDSLKGVAETHGFIDIYTKLASLDSITVVASVDEIRRRMAEGTSDALTEEIGHGYADIFGILNESPADSIADLFGPDNSLPVTMKVRPIWRLAFNGTVEAIRAEVSLPESKSFSVEF